MRQQSTTQLHIAAATFFIGTAWLILHPIITHTNTHTAGYDFFAYNWNFWWVRHALLNPDIELFRSNFVMFPAETSFGYHTLTIFWFPLWASLEPIIGTLAAVNVIIFLGAWLNGYLLFVWLRSEGVSARWALLGGFVLQTLPISRYFYYNTHLNLMDWFWLPIHLLIWKGITKSAETKHWRQLALWAAVHVWAIWGMIQTDLQFPIFVGFVLIPYGIYTLMTSSARFTLIGIGVVILALSMMTILPFGQLNEMLSFDGTRAISPVEDRPGIVFPDNFLRTSDRWWDWDDPTTGAFVGLLMLVTLLVALRYWRRVPRLAWLWFGITIPPLLFSMGADLTIGSLTIPMPYRLLFDLTDGMFRMPWRLAPVFLTSGLLFIGLVWDAVLPRRVLWVIPLFILSAASVRLFETAPLQPILYPYEFYDAIGDATGDFGIVEVPTGAGTGEVLLGDLSAIQFQYYGITHEKRMVNGFIARAPLEHYWYIQSDDPMLAWLGQRAPLDAATVETQLRDRIENWQMGYLIIHEDYVIRNGGRPEEIYEFLNQFPNLVCPWAAEHQAVAYRTASHPDGCSPRTPPTIEEDVYQIDLGTIHDRGFIGDGWHWVEDVGGRTFRWAQAETTLYANLPNSDYDITISAQAFFEPRNLTLMINGEPVDTSHTISEGGFSEYSFTALNLEDDLVLQFVADTALLPADVLPDSGDQRSLAVAIDWVNFQTVTD